MSAVYFRTTLSIHYRIYRKRTCVRARRKSRAGRHAARQLIRFLEQRPRKYVGAVTRRRDNRQSPSKNGRGRPSRRVASRQRHNGGTACAQYSRADTSGPVNQPGPPEMRGMSDASSRCAGHVTKDPAVVSDLRRTIRIIRHHTAR